uniref:Uncharacterized protein n=1 Tax=Kwoniella dejecticola CBS 10117 TaxID=1296121 RepID=A0A1A6AA90_9TREE|nr:uncharacterized protein I303_02999 [Kwoniella dejecticola CBS 10117]OBR86977.1 hypothetical protein I303_02999 [Kwoniella dejecticola CBS 10117]
MPPKAPHRNKRARSPPPASDNEESQSTITPPPKSKKPRSSRNHATTTAVNNSKPKENTTTKGSEAKQNSEKEDSNDDEMSSEPSSSVASENSHLDVGRVLDDDLDDEDRSSKNQSRSTHPSDREAFEAIMSEISPMTKERFKRFLNSSHKYLEIERAKEMQFTDDTSNKVRELWDVITEDVADEEEAEVKQDEGEIKAEKLANALAGQSTSLQILLARDSSQPYAEDRILAPLERLKAQSVTTLKEVNYTLNQAFQNSLEPLKGDEILQQLKKWREHQVNLARQTDEKWDSTVAFMADRKAKMEDIMRQILEVNTTKRKIVEKAKVDFDAMLKRHAEEVEGFRQEVINSKEKYRNKIIKATDEDRKKKEVNMLVEQFLRQSNS